MKSLNNSFPFFISIQQPPAFCYGGIPGMHGKPGSPGAPGRDGRDGREGAKGDQGSPGKTGPQGPVGTHGINGKNGAKGEPGVQGPPGQKGQRGETGTSGIPGTPGVMAFKNWKECAWKFSDGRDNGLIKVSGSFLVRITTEVKILGKILQVSEMLVPIRTRGPKMSILSSARHNMTIY